MGSLALEEGLITPSQLREALTERAREVAAGNKECTLGDVLIQMGLLDTNQVERFVRTEKRAHGEASEHPRASEPKSRETKFLVEGNFGKYRIRRKLGHGGMGVVYEALDPVLNRRVALKLLRRRDALTPEDAERDEDRFLREAQLSATLDRHPHIVGVYEAGMVRDRPYIAMELIEGRPMSDWLKSGGPSLRARVVMLRDVAYAVEVAHQRGIIHRDLSPKNVLVDEDHQPHVTDFGLAKSIGGEGGLSLTDPQMSVGTPNYMSPEQAQGLKTVNRRTDVYSLGVMLYEILAGRPPFEGDTTVQILVQVVRDPVQAPSKIREALEQSGDINPELERICLKAVEKHPDDRYPSAGAFAADLDRWLEGRKPPSRSGRGVAVGLMVLVLAAIPAALLWTPGGEEPPASVPSEPAPAAVPTEAVWEFPSRSERLRILESQTDRGEPVLRGGVECLQVRADSNGTRRLSLEVNDSWASTVAAAAVEVDYFDESQGGSFGLQFDSTEIHPETGGNGKWAGSVLFEASGAWRTATLFLANPRFAGEKEWGGDVTLHAKGAELLIRRVRIVPFAEHAKGQGVPGPLSARPVDPGILRPGVVGEYFSDTELEHRKLRRIDPAIRFEWKSGGPEGFGDRFSARWSGYFRVAESGRYLLEVRSDNGARLFVDDVEVISQWDAQVPTTGVAFCDLKAGYHKVVVEFTQGGGGAGILFSCLREVDSRMVGLEADDFFH